MKIVIYKPPKSCDNCPLRQLPKYVTDTNVGEMDKWQELKEWANENAFDVYEKDDDPNILNWCIKLSDLLDKMAELEKGAN